jgi:Carbon-nitrogen hydrolase
MCRVQAQPQRHRLTCQWQALAQLRVVHALQEAAARGCAMACLPECFNFIGSGPAETVQQAQPLTGAYMSRYCQLARCQPDSRWCWRIVLTQ